ncbi:hypothetical protein BSL78_08469, partial [Apostichopus japonicus]
KQTLFIECLRKKTKSWYETMTPLPWKKSCKWMTSELFIACGLVLTDSKSKMKTADVDEECKLKYTDILTHRRLKSATRIIIEGDPGSGKTMLSSQLAYDWSIGKSSDARMVVFLPLKFVDGMTIIEAIKQFYIPKGLDRVRHLVVEEGVMAREEETPKQERAVEEGMVTQDEIISIEDERREVRVRLKQQ